MFTSQLPAFLKGTMTALMGLIGLAIVVASTVLILSSSGVLSGDSRVNVSVPVQFELDEDAYSLYSPALGPGAITDAKADLSFNQPVDFPVVAGLALAFLVLLVGFIAVFTLYQMRQIFGSMADGAPFIRENVWRIRVVGIVVMTVDVLLSLLHVTISNLVVSGMEMDGVQLLSRFTLSLEPILAGLIIVALAEVFRYGAELKEETDLTI